MAPNDEERPKQEYCFCDRGNDSAGFMIGCDKCDSWFHGRCVKINKKLSSSIEKFFCDFCIRKDPSLKIIYKENSVDVLHNLPKVPKVKEEQPEEKKPDKKLIEKRQPTSLPPPSKQSPLKGVAGRRAYQRNKARPQSRKQCANPECIYECRPNSKYCTDKCGIAFNKVLYEMYYEPKYKALESNHSQARLEKMKELDRLDKDKIAVFQLIRDLRVEKEELEKTITQIKAEATEQMNSKDTTKSSSGKEKYDVDPAEHDEGLGSDQTGDSKKTFCFSCGVAQLPHKTLSHWAMCHKKQESLYAFTADVIPSYKNLCKEDEDPKLYCHHLDKKTKRYCMHLASACPQHANWQGDKNEVCGCPLKITQNLVADGNYCTELKRNCNIHYHWDKFRLAQLNLQRIQAFNRLEAIQERIRTASRNLADTYGGVVGVMLHNTINHASKNNEQIDEAENHSSEPMNVDVE